MATDLKRLVSDCAFRCRYWGGALTIAAFQIAPITMQRDEMGQLSLALGYGIGDLQQEIFLCYDTKTWDRNVKHRTLNGVAEYITPGGRIHATVMAGNFNSSIGPIRKYPSAAPDEVPDFPRPFNGSYLGALIGTEVPRLGTEWPGFLFQIGAIAFPREGERNRLEPSFRVRFRDIGPFDLQVDHLTVLTPGSIPMTSVGLVLGNADKSARPSGILALGLPKLSEYRAGDYVELAARGEFSLPLGKHADISLGGVVGGGSLNHISGGLRLFTRGRDERPPPNARR